MSFKKFRSMMLPAIFFLTAQVSIAQTKSVSGRVTDSRDGSGLPQVSVIVKGTSTGTTTDENGNFSIDVPSSANALVISAVGFATQEVSIAASNQVSVSLSASSNTNLNEVVVVGYGTSRKKDITGAVTKVSAREFNTGNIANPLQQVQGKVAGLVIVQPGSDPNSNMTVRLRGSTSLEGQPPLLVIDGVAIDDFNRGINSIAPNDIEYESTGLAPGVARLDVLAALLPALRHAAAARGPLTSDELRAYAERDALAGRALRAPVAGTVQGIASTGELRVAGADGREHRLRQATITLAD